MRENVDEIDLISLKIIEKNALNKSTREANERKEDLARVLHRVENIYGEFEKPLPFSREFSTFFIANKKTDASTSIEIVEDVPTLEQMLGSHECRQKYLQQVTVFIVGYSKVAQERLRIMQEVNQFFLNSEGIFDTYIARESKIFNEETETVHPDKNDNQMMVADDEEPDYTVSELSESMEQSIEACKNLTNRLGELNNEIIECFSKYAQNKAGNKGKKKMEKSLESALNETSKLNEKLTQTYKVITEKESRIDSLMKQCETKTKEVQKYKAAAESIKKAALESDKLRDLIKDRDAKIMKLESELMQSQMKIDEVKTVDAAQRINAEALAKEYQEKSLILEKTLQNQRIEFEEYKREMSRQQTIQLKQVQAELEDRINQTKIAYEQETKQLKSSEFDENAVALHWSEPETDMDRPLTKSLSSISKNNNEVLPDSNTRRSKSASRTNSAPNKVESRPLTQIGSARSSDKDIWMFDDAPDLDDEDFWSNIPRNHLLGRFSQYRQMSRMARSSLQDDLESANHATNRQIHSLKAQHQAHKHRWDEEREMLIEALRKVEEEKKEIQAYADNAVAEMENFLSFMKNEDSTNVNMKSNVDINQLNMLEIIEYIRDYLDQQKSLKEPISSMISTLISKCQRLQERARISLPKFSTMIDLRKNKTEIKETIETNSQTETTAKVEENLGNMDENKDIMFPEETDNDENGMKDVAVSASPSLLKIALREYNSNGNKNDQDNNANIERVGVTAKDLETPSNFIDVEDMTGLGLIQHPIVVDYLHSYDQILTFKEHFLTALDDSDRGDASDVMELRKIKPISIRSHSRIIPQVEEMGRSIEQILTKCGLLVEKTFFGKKKTLAPSKNKETSNQPSMAKGKQIFNTRPKTNYIPYFNYINRECVDLRIQIKTIKQSFIIKFNVINSTMTKMKQLLTTLMHQSLKAQIEDEVIQKMPSKIEEVTEPAPFKNVVPSYDSLSILFTRKDSESNIRRLQQAMLQNKIDDVIYKEAVERMSDYLDIPARRLLVLVKKYMHRASMLKISEYVKRHNDFNAETFKILDKMEDANEKRIQRYDKIQEYFRNERILRANAMLGTFDDMQNYSSIFLIRPVLAVSSRQVLKHLVSTTSIVNETESLKKTYLVKSERYAIPTFKRLPKESDDETKPSTEKMWKPDFSLNEDEYNPRALIESKLFEIDTNRMLLPLNNVSTFYNIEDMNDGLPMLPPNVAVRSYVAVAHPTLIDMNTENRMDTLERKGTTPGSASRSRLSKDLSKHAPLPPISSTPKNSDFISINDDIVDCIN